MRGWPTISTLTLLAGLAACTAAPPAKEEPLVDMVSYAQHFTMELPAPINYITFYGTAYGEPLLDDPQKSKFYRPSNLKTMKIAIGPHGHKMQDVPATILKGVYMPRLEDLYIEVIEPADTENATLTDYRVYIELPYGSKAPDRECYSEEYPKPDDWHGDPAELINNLHAELVPDSDNPSGWTTDHFTYSVECLGAESPHAPLKQP